MQTNIAAYQADIESAQASLRNVLVGDFRESATVEAGSLARILTHVENIQRAIAESPACHDNAAKRLGDFADITLRMESRFPKWAEKFSAASKSLRAASVRLRDSARVADEATPAA